jgi:hypothetical protein
MSKIRVSKNRSLAIELFEKANKTEGRNDFFSAALLYKEALRLFKQLGDSEKIKICKRKMIEMNQKALKSFKIFEIELKETETSKEEKLKYINYIINGDIDEVFLKIGLSEILCPNKKSIEQSSNPPIAFEIVSLSGIDDKGHIIKGSSKGKDVWFMHMYRLNQDYISKIYVRNLFKKLININKFDSTGIESLFCEVKINQTEIMRVGFKHYFDGDYVSAMHILIPQFENLFLSLSSRLGANIISDKEDASELSTKTTTLDEYSIKKFDSIWGEDFCEQISFVFFKSMGYKLRHRVAHGEITLNECCFENASLILYFYISLITKFLVKNTD